METRSKYQNKKQPSTNAARQYQQWNNNIVG